MMTHKETLGSVYLAWMLITLSALFSFSCGLASPSESRFSGKFEAAEAPMAKSMSMDESRSAPASARKESEPSVSSNQVLEVPSTERKLIHQAQFQIRVSELDTAEERVRSSVESLGGYVSQAYSDESSLSLTLRLPQENFDKILEGLPALGKVLSRTISAEDVTLKYFDLSGRLETKRLLATTFRGYLKTAKNIEDIMTVETRLAELQDEIDALGGEFTHLADLVNFATVDLSLFLPDTSVLDVGPTLFERIASIFIDFGTFLSAFAAGIVAVVVYGIPIALVAAFSYWLLFGKIGLLIRLFRLVAGKKSR